MVCKEVSLTVTVLSPVTGRLSKCRDGKDTRGYVAKARRSIVLNAAARAWAHGVPWAEALTIAQRAIDAAGSGMPKGHAKGRGRGKGKGKG